MPATEHITRITSPTGMASGCVIAPRLMLTAAHLVADPGGEVAFSNDIGSYTGRVVWRGLPSKNTDVALVEITDSSWPASPVSVRWGFPMDTTPCHTWGYPDLALRTGHSVGACQPSGTIDPRRSRLSRDRYVMDISVRPPLWETQGSPWNGLSGAAVVCGDLVVGVVATDPADSDHRWLEAVPAFAPLDDPACRAVLEEHGVPWTVQPIRPLGPGDEDLDADKPPLTPTLAYLSDFAMARKKLADIGAALNALDKALESITDAVGQYRRLTERRPDVFLPDLATCLNSQGRRLGDLGRHEQALAAVNEALEIRRDLVEQRPDAFLPDLADSLIQQANQLAGLGRLEQALAASTESLEIRRDLVEQRPDAFLPDLADSLICKAGDLAALGHREEALDLETEAVGHCRVLVEQNRDAFLPRLSLSLNNQATQLGALGRREQALEATAEAIEIRRELAERNPEAFLPDLAMSLGNQGVFLRHIGQDEQALAAATEALDIR
jgi:tetratricopeptide (TPR) repeat protein